MHCLKYISTIANITACSHLLANTFDFSQLFSSILFKATPFSQLGCCVDKWLYNYKVEIVICLNVSISVLDRLGIASISNHLSDWFNYRKCILQLSDGCSTNKNSEILWYEDVAWLRKSSYVMFVKGINSTDKEMDKG